MECYNCQESKTCPHDSRSVASYFSIPYAALDIYATCSYYDIQNAVDCRHGFAGTYASAASGSYAIPW